MEPLRPDDPRRIGNHLVAGRLEASGLGQAFLAHSPAHLPVAITVVHPQLAGDPGFRSRFRQDVTAARAVAGAYISAIVDADTEARLPWLARAHLPALTLQEAGPLPAQAVHTLGVGLAEALISIHRAGVVHGSLTPAAVLLTQDGLRVTGFGLPREAADLGCVAPERVTASLTEPAGDVFSLGVCLTHAAIGHGPFGDGPSHVLLYRVVHEPPKLDGIPDAALRDLIAACLAKEPDERPTSQQVLDALAATEMPDGLGWAPPEVGDRVTAIAAHPTGSNRPAPSSYSPQLAVAGPQPVEEPRRHPLRPALAAAVVVGVLAVAMGATNPALWRDGTACAAVGDALRIPLAAQEPMPDLSPGQPLTLEELKAQTVKRNAWSERRKKAREEQELLQRAAIKTAASRADSPELKRALEGIAAKGMNTGWAEVNRVCG